MQQGKLGWKTLHQVVEKLAAGEAGEENLAVGEAEGGVENLAAGEAGLENLAAGGSWGGMENLAAGEAGEGWKTLLQEKLG